MKRTQIARISKVAGGFIIGFAVASCIVQSEPEKPVQPVKPAAETATEDRPTRTFAQQLAERDAELQAVPAGAYSCTIDNYSPFPCRVTTDPDGRKRLEKISGSQLFSGIVTSRGGGFEFRGTYYCPHGSCTQAVSGEFVAYDDGLFRGTLSTSPPVTVTLQYTELAAYGGNAYGGNLYGGNLYGGNLYGAHYDKRTPYKVIQPNHSVLTKSKRPVIDGVLSGNP